MILFFYLLYISVRNNFIDYEEISGILVNFTCEQIDTQPNTFLHKVTLADGETYDIATRHYNCLSAQLAKLNMSANLTVRGRLLIALEQENFEILESEIIKKSLEDQTTNFSVLIKLVGAFVIVGFVRLYIKIKERNEELSNNSRY